MNEIKCRGEASVTAKAAGPAGGAVDGFLLAYDGFDPGTEGLREALTSTGNGYLCTRGAAEWEDADGVHYPGTYAHGGYNRETALQSRGFVSMADPHHAGIEWTLVPENWSGHVEVISALDARVSNGGVARYRQLEGRHLSPVSPRTSGPEVIALKARTRQSNLYISQARRTLHQMEDYIQQVLAFDVRQGEATRVEKMVAFYTSRDPAVSDTLVRAARSAARHGDFPASFERHSAAWDELWRACDGRVSGNEQVQVLLRLHTAQR